MEPIDGPVRVPVGGWPKALMRVELLPDLRKAEAIYEVAGAARRWGRGVVADYCGTVLVAWPHQTVSEVDRTYDRIREAAVDFGAAEIPERWTATRKAWVCTGIVSGAITEEEARTSFDLSADELTEWLSRFRAFGVGGLAARRVITEATG